MTEFTKILDGKSITICGSELLIEKVETLLQKLIEHFGLEKGSKFFDTLLINNGNIAKKNFQTDQIENCSGFCDKCDCLSQFTDIQGFDKYFNTSCSKIFYSCNNAVRLIKKETSDEFTIIDTSGRSTWCFCSECYKEINSVFFELNYTFNIYTYQKLITDMLINNLKIPNNLVESFQLFDNFHHLVKKNIKEKFPDQDLICPETEVINSNKFFELCESINELPTNYTQFFQKFMLEFSRVLSAIFTEPGNDFESIKHKIIEVCQEHPE